MPGSKGIVLTGSQELKLLIEQGKRLSGVEAYELRRLWLRLMLHTMKRAQKRAPHKEGHLQRSATTRTQDLPGKDLVSVIRFGGLAEPYAEVQHEREDFEHKPGRVDHFLYGRPHSAYNAAQARMILTMVERHLIASLKATFRNPS